MKWDDVRRIMTEPLPIMRLNPEKLGKKEPSSTLSDVMKKVEKYVFAQSEMEAVVRVFQILIEAIDDGDDKILVKLQPSIAGHPTFTDCFIVSRGEREDDPLFFIEVKKSSESADISSPCPSSAQTLREAHILLCESSKVSEIPFVLTNSKHWSFVFAKKHGNMIKVAETFELNVNFSNCQSEEMKKLIFCLNKMLHGQWPLPAPVDTSSN